MSRIKSQASYLIYVILAITPLVCGRTEWVDPYSMEEDPRLKCDCPSTSLQHTSQHSSAISSYYIRTINILLKSLRYNDEVHSAHFEVALVKEDYSFMQSFLENLKQSGDSSPQDLERMDKLLTQMFTNMENSYVFQLISWKDYLQVHIFSKEFGVALGCIFICWFLFKLKYSKFHFWSMLKYFIFVLYVVDYVYTWIYMLKEKELEQMLHATYTVPPECNVKNMNYFQYVQYLLNGHANCAEYHKIKDIDIFWSVSPSQVFGNQIGNLVLAPAEKFGNAFSKLIGGVLNEVPWYMMIPAMLAIPLLLLCLLMAGCVLLSFVTGRGFSFNVMHLFQFSFGGGASENKGRSQQMPAIHLTLPQLQIGVASGSGSRKRQLRLKGEKKTSMTAIEGKRQVEVEDVPEAEAEDDGSSSSGEEDVIVLQEDATTSLGSNDNLSSKPKSKSKKFEFVEDEYEVIS